MTDEAQRFWDRVYGRRVPSRDPRPHPGVVEELGGIAPGEALDLGCGEGANAIWLATQGWTVTGVDVSGVALERARTHARKAGVASRVSWKRADLENWATSQTFDLVMATFVHTPLELDYAPTLAENARRTRVGGRLLIIGHHTLPPWAWDPKAADDLMSAAELADELELRPPDWEVLRAKEVARPSYGPEGQEATVSDAVLVASRV